MPPLDWSCQTVFRPAEGFYTSQVQLPAPRPVRTFLPTGYHPNRFAGIISLNGLLPRTGTPLLRLNEVRGLRVLIGHGIANAVLPLTLARNDFRLLYTAGMAVDLLTYPTTNRLHPHMLRDVD